MKKYWKYIKPILIGILVLVILYFVIVLFTKKPQISDNSSKKLDSLTNVINLAEDSIIISKNIIVNLKDSIEVLQQDKNKINTKINNITTYYETKINNVDHYNNDSLEKFFTNRYH